MRRRMRLKTRVVSNNATKRFVRFSRLRYGLSDTSLVVAQDLQGRRAEEGRAIYPSLESSASGTGKISTFELLGPVDGRYYNPSVNDSVRSSQVSRRALVTPLGHSTANVSIVPRGRRYEFLGFDVPSSVLVCVRRKQRRQVLFAKGKNGRNRRPRWNVTSHIWC